MTSSELSDLHLDYQKVTWKKLVIGVTGFQKQTHQKYKVGPVVSEVISPYKNTGEITSLITIRGPPCSYMNQCQGNLHGYMAMIAMSPG